MADNNLPIKIFDKRKIDERKTEGGGSSNLPSWVLELDKLHIKAGEFIPTIEDTLDSFEKRVSNRKFIPMTLEVEIDDVAIAKSHRNEMRKVFNVNNKSNFIGFRESNNALVKVDNADDAKSIKRNIEDYPKHRVALSAIQAVNIYTPFIEVDQDNSETDSLKVSIINYQDYELNRAVKGAFLSFCEGMKIESKESNYAPDLIIFRVDNPSTVIVDQLKEFEAIESITIMPKYKIEFDALSTESELEVKEPDKSLDYPVVGVLDSGISQNRYLSPWLVTKSHSNYPEDRIDRSHGSFVASIILYGDALEGTTHTGLEGCYIFDATVIPDSSVETIYEDQLIENIREAISANSEIKIWNLSLGTANEADSDQFSDFAIALDSIQGIHNVLICKSTGNCTNYKHGLPKSRIAQPADSVRSLVVGSIAHAKNEHDMAEIDHPSPFTRIGRGPANIIKPDLVHYGGNAGPNSTTGVRGMDANGIISSEIGTSFSTPRITGLLASLNFNVAEDFNPLLLKALAIHSAKYPDGIQMSISDKIKQLGFGLPDSVNDIIYNDPYEITLILQDTIVKGEYTEILEFPYPDKLINEDYYYGDIKLTLVASPVLREKQGSEYCQSNLEIKFGTYDREKERDIEKPTILNEIGPDGNENLLKDGSYKAQYRREFTSQFARERMLINYGRKYHPIKKYAVNLEELTNSNKENYLKTPKKWYLKVSGFYRDFAETSAMADGEQLSQEFCVIMTIRDNKKQIPVYNEVSQLLSSRNFNHSNIKLRSEIRIDNI